MRMKNKKERYLADLVEIHKAVDNKNIYGVTHRGNGKKIYNFYFLFCLGKQNNKTKKKKKMEFKKK